MSTMPVYFPVPSTKPEMSKSVSGESDFPTKFSVARKGGKGADNPPGIPGSKGQSDSGDELTTDENMDENLLPAADEFPTDTDDPNNIANEI